MLLQNLHIYGKTERSDIRITGTTITAIGQDETLSASGETRLAFENALVLPGLINSHDHLDFDLFPLMGTRIYPNYIEWGADIQEHYKTEIEAVHKVPEALRVQWGIIKNLLAGVTTVVNHGKKLSLKNPLIDVFQSCHSLHSVNREPNWKLKLNNPFAKAWPWVIHAGEGTDVGSNQEIDQLLRWNLLKRKLVAIHGVAMREVQADKFEALVWCPASNYFLLDQTAPVNKLNRKTNILFGTDSTLTGHWNIWEQLRLAKKTGLLPDKELLDALTVTPAIVWGLADRGTIAPGRKADLVVLRSQREVHAGNLWSLNPEDILLVMKDGAPLLFDESLLVLLKEWTTGFNPFMIKGSRKYIEFELAGLVKEIQQYLPAFEFPVTIL